MTGATPLATFGDLTVSKSGDDFTLVATSGAITATSGAFSVVNAICLAGASCLTPFNQGGDSTIATDVASGLTATVNFIASAGSGDGMRCGTAIQGGVNAVPWNRTYYTTGGTAHYFPQVLLRYQWGTNKLTVTYYILNSQWLLTNTASSHDHDDDDVRDPEFCFGGKHEVNTALNGTIAGAFPAKSGTLATWDPATQLYWGVLRKASSCSAVTTNPAVCARSLVNLTTGGVTAAYRSWKIVIPYDWDPKIAP